MKQDERHHTSDDIFVGIDLATRQHQVVVLDAQGCANSWSAARPVESAEKVGYTSRSRPPGTCGRRSVPSLSSTYFGITWSIRWRPFGCARPGRWVETSKTSPTRSRSRSCFARESSPSGQLLPANYMQLRRAWGEYHRLRRERARLKTLLVHQLYGVFPELVGEWHTVTAPGCLAVLRAGWPPQRIADLTKPDFIRVVQAHRRGRRMWRFKIEQVWEKAGGTVAAPHGHQAAVREVTRLVERIDFVGDQLAQVAGELQTFLEAFDEATYLATLPGIGWITIAGLIAEIGPFDRYQHGRQLVKLAGLQPSRRERALVRGCGQAYALQTVEPVTYRCGTRRVCQARSSGSERDTRARPHAVAPMNCVPEDSRRRSTCTGRTHSPRARADGHQTPSSTVAGRAPSPS